MNHTIDTERYTGIITMEKCIALYKLLVHVWICIYNHTKWRARIESLKRAHMYAVLNLLWKDLIITIQSV